MWPVNVCVCVREKERKRGKESIRERVKHIKAVKNLKDLSKNLQLLWEERVFLYLQQYNPEMFKFAVINDLICGPLCISFMSVWALWKKFCWC